MTGAPLEQLIVDVCHARKDREILALISRGEISQAYSGDKLLAAAQHCAERLAPLRGRAVVLAFPTNGMFIPILLGCFLSGVIAVPVSPPRRGSASTRLMHICKEVHPVAILCPEGQEEWIGDTLGEGGPPVIGWSDTALLSTPAGMPRFEAPGTVLVQYTSGSTQNPKGVLITGRNILENCALVQHAWGLDERARFVNWMPHFHDMGLIGGVLYPFLSGGMSIQMSPFDFIRSPKLWLKAISDWRATFSGGPAFAYMDVLRRVPASELDGLDLSCWQRAYCGAEPIPAGLLERFADHLSGSGLRRKSVFACYGMAEITLFAAGSPDSDDAASSQGITHGCTLTPETQAQIAIVDPETKQPVAKGQTGEIWLGGPSQGQGYLAQPSMTAADFHQKLEGHRGEFLRTGDIGRIAQGRLWITGRLKEVLFAHGLTIPANEVEQLACSRVPELNALAAAAFMRDEQISGQAVLIVELLDSRRPPPDPDSVRTQIHARVLGEWGLDLVDVQFVPRGQLPRTTSGKIRRTHVAELYRQGETALITDEAN